MVLKRVGLELILEVGNCLDLDLVLERKERRIQIKWQMEMEITRIMEDQLLALVLALVVRLILILIYLHWGHLHHPMLRDTDSNNPCMDSIMDTIVSIHRISRTIRE